MLSIIIPIYNQEAFLETCLRSVMQQTYADLEILLIDDGSTDRSAEICFKLLEEDKRLQYFYKENGGLSDARNYGLERMTGDYLMFVDSDDYLHPRACEILIDALEREDADLAVGNFKRVEKHEKPNEVVGRQWVFEGHAIHLQLFNENAVRVTTAWGKIYRAELFEGLRYPKGKIHEDEFLAFRILYRARRMVLTDAEIYFYMQHSDSIMGNGRNEKSFALLEMVAQEIDFFIEKEEIELQNLAVQRAYGLCQMLYKDFMVLGKKKFVNQTLECYRSFIHTYDRYSGCGKKDWVRNRLYARCPKLIPMFDKMYEKMHS